MSQNRPSRGHEYNFVEICNLDLDDDPYLGFTHEGKRGVVQTTHVDNSDLLEAPGFANTKWRYIRTTSEWIPVFESVDVESLLKCVDIEPSTDIHSDPHWWVTPKGYPREQYVWED